MKDIISLKKKKKFHLQKHQLYNYIGDVYKEMLGIKARV
jgi:hypothetical protein